MLTGRVVTLEELCEAPVTKPPKASSRWKGLQHGELAKAVEDELDSRDKTCIGMTCLLSGSGRKSEVRFHFDLPWDDETFVALVVANNNSGGEAIKAYSCARDGITVPLLRLPYQSRHTLSSSASGEAEKLVDTFLGSWGGSLRVLQRLKACRPSPEAYARLLLRIGREGWVPWSQVGVADLRLFPFSVGSPVKENERVHNVPATGWRIAVQMAAVGAWQSLSRMPKILKVVELICRLSKGDGWSKEGP